VPELMVINPKPRAVLDWAITKPAFTVVAPL